MGNTEAADAAKDRWIQIAAIGASLMAAGLAFVIYDHGGQKKLEAYLENISGKQVEHFEASEKREEKQDARINIVDDRSRANEMNIRLIGPIAREDAVTRTISLVQHAIECEQSTCDESCWVHVPGASGGCVPEDVRLSVEEYFRRLGYNVCRERPTDVGEFRGFWIFVNQTT